VNVELAARATEALGEVMDPELGIDVVSLGLIQSIEVEGSCVRVRLMMTTPSCPLGEHIRSTAEERLRAVPGVTDAAVELVRDPWSPDRLTPGAREALGW
jgi:metal-sulfur cluster biosynthetic enzyme